MNLSKYLPFILSAMMLDAHAETIDAHVAGSYSGGIPSSATAKACKKVVFITRNNGALVTGLSSSSLKLVSAQRSVLNMTTGAYVSSAVSISYSLAATPQPGAYTLCITPANFTWSAARTMYAFDFVVNGSAPADHGVLSLALN